MGKKLNLDLISRTKGGYDNLYILHMVQRVASIVKNNAIWIHPFSIGKLFEIGKHLACKFSRLTG